MTARRMRELSARILTIQEDERRHISRDLHDDVGQSLTALKIGLHRLEPLLPTEGLKLLGACTTIADETIEHVRQLAHDMHPPQLDQLGLEEAIRSLVERQRANTGLDIKSHFNGLLGRHVPATIASACYRIAQEALRNCCSHANPSSTLVCVEAGVRTLRLTVRDDGKGFDTRGATRWRGGRGGLGLISMAERAKLAGGTLEVTSEPAFGTQVRASFPLEARKGAS